MRYTINKNVQTQYSIDDVDDAQEAIDKVKAGEGEIVGLNETFTVRKMATPPQKQAQPQSAQK